jgi:hypothetical protein
MCGRYWHHHTVRRGKLQYCRWLALAFSRVEDNRDIEGWHWRYHNKGTTGIDGDTDLMSRGQLGQMVGTDLL